MKPGEFILEDREIEANVCRKTVRLTVRNAGDRPIQVGTHFHFFEVNRKLLFEREKALGMRLNIPAGTAVRFEAGQSHEVELVELGGDGLIHGFNRLVEGNINDPSVRKAALEKMTRFIEGETEIGNG